MDKLGDHKTEWSQIGFPVCIWLLYVAGKPSVLSTLLETGSVGESGSLDSGNGEDERAIVASLVVAWEGTVRT